MQKRKIITINEGKCNGCGACIPNCPEGAIQLIDGKARLVSDLFCDGLGACLGHCPQGAIAIEERLARPYEELTVMQNIIPQGMNVIKAHLTHLREHGQLAYLHDALQALKENNITIDIEYAPTSHASVLADSQPIVSTEVEKEPLAHAGTGCPGAKVMDFRRRKETAGGKGPGAQVRSQLRQWPVQLMLVPPSAPYLNGADLLIAADCVPFTYAGFHQYLLKGKILLVGCPKFDDLNIYQEKLTQILEYNIVKSITYAHMEVPCCFGLVDIIKEAIARSTKQIPFHDLTIGIDGELRDN